MNSMLVKYNQYAKYENVRVTIPRTVVVATDYFDAFIRNNGLDYVLTTEMTDEEILSEFVSSTLPYKLREALKAYCAHGERAAGGAVVVEARGFSLPALRRYLLDLHDPLHGGQRGSSAASVAEGDQERLRVDLLRRVEGLRASRRRT